MIALDQIVVQLSEESSVTILEMASIWKGRVGRLQAELSSEGRGALVADDYVGDLSWRTILEEAMRGNGLTPSHPGLEDVQSADAIFRRLTEADRGGAARHVGIHPAVDGLDEWWWERIPPTGELRAALTAVMDRASARPSL